MARGYIVDKDTGKQLYFGCIENKQKLIDAGHTVVPADKPTPADADPTHKTKHLHVWNGSAWVEDADLVAADAALTKEVELRKTDSYTPFVAADLIDILIAKNILSLSDFPQDSQDKITERKNLRR
jgi:hypothetical protein